MYCVHAKNESQKAISLLLEAVTHKDLRHIYSFTDWNQNSYTFYITLSIFDFGFFEPVRLMAILYIKLKIVVFLVRAHRFWLLTCFHVYYCWLKSKFYRIQYGNDNQFIIFKLHNATMFSDLENKNRDCIWLELESRA